MNEPPTYFSYILRLWKDDATTPWRASLQPVSAAERLGFADLDTLFAFLAEQTGAMPQPAEEVPDD